jgi:hypothetical protein
MRYLALSARTLNWAPAHADRLQTAIISSDSLALGHLHTFLSALSFMNSGATGRALLTGVSHLREHPERRRSLFQGHRVR